MDNQGIRFPEQEMAGQGCRTSSHQLSGMDSGRLYSAGMPQGMQAE
jgi:hypothetical protein